MQEYNNQKKDRTIQRVTHLFSTLKASGASLNDQDKLFSRIPVIIWPVSMRMPGIDEFIKKATAWRLSSNRFFFSQFIPTEVRTRNWIRNITEDMSLKILLLLKDKHGVLFGHIDFEYNPDERLFEAGSIMRGRAECKGGMTIALSALCDWIFKNFSTNGIFLRCFADNLRAISLYKRCGFEEMLHQQYYSIEVNGEIIWKPNVSFSSEVPPRNVILMRKLPNIF